MVILLAWHMLLRKKNVLCYVTFTGNEEIQFADKVQSLDAWEGVA